MSKSITVAVCSYNRHHLLSDCLSGIAVQETDGFDFGILVVDNSSDRNSAEDYYSKNSLPSQAHLIWSSPPGLSRARNLAAHTVSSDLIVYIDDDARPEPGWLREIVAGFRPGTGFVGGPIMAVWPPQGRPNWLPAKFDPYFTALDLGTADRPLADWEYVWGANMAFDRKALINVGGFSEAVGRVGEALLSNEELETQRRLRNSGLQGFYAARAAVRHHVDANRLRRNWLRSRVAWQTVSEFLQEPPEFPMEQAVRGLQDISVDENYKAAIRTLLGSADGSQFSNQLDAIRWVTGFLMGGRAFEDSFLREIGVDDQEARTEVEAVPDNPSYHPSAAIPATTQHVFVEGVPGHRYLFDLYGEIPHSHIVTLEASVVWGNETRGFRSHAEYVARSLPASTRSIFFITLDAFLYGANRDEFLQFVRDLPAPVSGIVHRMPETTDQIRALREFAAYASQICFLSSAMTAQAVSVLGLNQATYLPHHPISYRQRVSSQEVRALRARLGVAEHQVVLGLIGEARHGKGLDLVLGALEHVPPSARKDLFLLIAGKGRDYSDNEVRAGLLRSRTNGHVDLRATADQFQYSVLSDHTYARYLAATDIGLLLYHGPQRACMSGALGDFAWLGKPILATEDSYVGQEVSTKGIGVTVRSETPESIAAGIVESIRFQRSVAFESEAFVRYRSEINPVRVTERLQAILEIDVSVSATMTDVKAA